MNIYFTSYGLDIRYEKYMNSYQDIIQVLKNKRVAIIPNAKLIHQDRTCAVIAKQELDKNNISSVIIDIDTEPLYIEDFDALYLSGGEPKYLMESILKSNLDDKMRNFIDQGGIMIGQSAGAMIFNKSYLDSTTDQLLVMENGFDYFNQVIVPHYDHLSELLLKQLPDNIFKIQDTDRLIKLNQKKS